MEAVRGLAALLLLLGCDSPCTDGYACPRVELVSWCTRSAPPNTCLRNGLHVVCLPRCTADGGCLDVAPRCDFDGLRGGDVLTIKLDALPRSLASHRALVVYGGEVDKLRVVVDGVTTTRDTRGRFVWPLGGRVMTVEILSSYASFSGSLVDPDCVDRLCDG